MLAGAVPSPAETPGKRHIFHAGQVPSAQGPNLALRGTARAPSPSSRAKLAQVCKKPSLLHDSKHN